MSTRPDIEQSGGQPCPFGDPFCPCQDGDTCHYVDDEDTGTAAMPPPSAFLEPE